MRTSLDRIERRTVAVVGSLLVLVVVGATLGISWLVTETTRTTRYTESAFVNRVELDLGSAGAEIDGGSPSDVAVERVDRFSFGHSAREERSMSDGVLHLRSRCPRIIVGSCSAFYRVSIPEGVAVSLRTTSGDVHLVGVRGGASVDTGSGNVTVDAFCGFDFAAQTVEGEIRVATACAPRTLTLGSDSGSIVALVPPGRYRTIVTSATGSHRVSGITNVRGAPFSVEARSHSGDVRVEGGV